MPRYRCTQCGNCCRWPGLVRVSDQEIDRMARHLGLTSDAFIERYTTLAPERNGLVLTDREDGACGLLDGDAACRVHPVKPGQCVRFPDHWRVPDLEKVCEAIRLD